MAKQGEHKTILLQALSICLCVCVFACTFESLVLLTSNKIDMVINMAILLARGVL